MQLSTKGIVIKEKNIGESDRMLTILTENSGIVFARARGANRVKNKNSAATDFLSYSQFELFKNRDIFIVDSAEPIALFYQLRVDIVKLSLASYFAQLLYYLAKAEQDTSDFLRLVLNTLYFLQGNKKSENMLKALFELRSLSMAGYMPDLVGCSSCGSSEGKKIYFSPYSGGVKCQDCLLLEEKRSYRFLPQSVFYAMRHIVYADFAKLFSFSLNEDNMKYLADISEEYLLCQLDIKIQTLEFYHSLLQ